MDSAEEVAESAQGDPRVSRPTGVTIQSQVSASHPNEDLMGSSIKATAVAWAEALVVNPLPCILRDDSSESEGDAAGAGSASASASEETSVKAGRLAKAQHLEELEAESEVQPLSALPQVPETASTSS